MLIHSEAEMLSFGKSLAQRIAVPALIELVGDVGAGKTTLTRGLAHGLGVEEEITSPSFTISKSYRGKKADLTHYDFYRLGDPGLMMDDLAESISDPRLVTVVEWAQSVQDILPADRKIITIKYIDENTRELIEQ
jgi:tRNA threonylcarbamoyladenosine biosynthesis protein TsaE